ncbi:LysM peptidoglycan-binding domain-containing protein [Klenkia sp. PcliD-1-E]|uniref:LysM peptidoglycan-binding domain-containing protein n=1 Tax=Klenkia sp. PcliD-1-E TaxID=2954492 RepID=UPI0020970457|nr:LysM peptidoglycan-binding domain-containing protein [Klenkia sp. PcliD-1-E]MCO7218592.1 LysM peptidoglycan-binding domain-containing protein [Klenkia sp. PcliD-1-E]
MNAAMRVARGIGALLVLVGVVVGVPVLLVALGLVPDHVPTAGEVVATLNARDDGQLLRSVLGAGAWVCWLVFATATAAELWAVAMARPVPRLPGLGSVQAPVAALVAAVVLALGLATPASQLSPVTSADRPPLPVALMTAAAPGASEVPVAAAPADGSAEPGPQYVVERRDTLWGLAERYLGDPLRYTEIVALNRDVVGPDSRITPGTTLLLPPDAAGLSAEDGAQGANTQVLVQPGDSLWSITEDATGDGDDWPAVWDANAGRAQPGGAAFTDPDLIRPGWTISVPGPAQTTEPNVPVPTPSETLPSPAPSTPSFPPPPSTAPPSSSPAAPSSAATPAATSGAASDGVTAEPDATDGVPAAAAVGAASALAAMSLLALHRYRRRQFRLRRPGRPLPPVPRALGSAERALQRAGHLDVAWFDTVLRSLVTPAQGTAPDVVAVGVDAQAVTVVLAGQYRSAPAPWVVDETGTRWSLQRTAALPDSVPAPGRGHAPFPCLAAIGTTVSGQQWFLDLERAGVVSITGDEHRIGDFLRYLAAELAHNPWSEMMRVDAVGIGGELADLNPDRLVLHQDPDEPTQQFSRSARQRIDLLTSQPGGALRARTDDLEPEAWAPRVLISGAAGESVQLCADGLDRIDGRAGLALVAPVRGDGRGLRLHIDSSGAANVPALGLHVHATQLPADEAAALAQLLAHAASVTTTQESEGAPADDETSPAVRDVVGGMTDRNAPHLEPVDSVLPQPDATYLKAAATTAEDLNMLAPVSSEIERRRAQVADPDLDRDLADWADPHCRRPKVTLLGPVRVDAQGELPTRNPRRQFYTEVVAYLITRPDGATSEQYATALWPDEPDVVGKTKVRQSISVVRTWLGVDPDGADYLPSGLSAAAGGRYRISGALVDADLFRRLRARGLARGADGIDDLQRALDLVSGKPFELPDLRVRGVGGYGWLLDDGERLDLELPALIVDVAHIVATHHLGNGEPERAASAAHSALRSGTYEDVPLLDLVAACDAMGNQAEASAYVTRILANHDAEVEEDLPPRTAEVLFRRNRLD